MRLFLLSLLCLMLILATGAQAELCAPYCETDKIKYDLSDKTIATIEPSKTYKISGKVLSIDELRPHAGPPRLDKCYEKYSQYTYKLVTYRSSGITPLDNDGNLIEILENHQPLKYLTFAIKDSELSYKENQELGEIQEGDSFSADAKFSGDECLSEIWISNLKFSGRVIKN